MNLHLLRTLRNSNEKVIYRKLWNRSIFDLDVEHMSAVFVSDDGQLENMLSMSDVFDIFCKCCYSSHAPTRL